MPSLWQNKCKEYNGNSVKSQISLRHKFMGKSNFGKTLKTRSRKPHIRVCKSGKIVQVRGSKKGMPYYSRKKSPSGYSFSGKKSSSSISSCSCLLLFMVGVVIFLGQEISEYLFSQSKNKISKVNESEIQAKLAHYNYKLKILGIAVIKFQISLPEFKENLEINIPFAKYSQDKKSCFLLIGSTIHHISLDENKFSYP
jgi:hypothetical protein